MPRSLAVFRCIDPNSDAFSRAVDHPGTVLLQQRLVNRQVRFPEQQAQVGLAGADQRAGKGTDLDRGEDRAAALGHAVGFRGQHRDAPVDRDLGDDPGQEQHALAADSADDDLLFHDGCSLTMALTGQTGMQVPQPMQAVLVDHGQVALLVQVQGRALECSDAASAADTAVADHDPGRLLGLPDARVHNAAMPGNQHGHPALRAADMGVGLFQQFLETLLVIWIAGFEEIDAARFDQRFDGDRLGGFAPGRYPHVRDRLPAGHGGGGVVEDHHDHPHLLEDGIDQRGESRHERRSNRRW